MAYLHRRRGRDKTVLSGPRRRCEQAIMKRNLRHVAETKDLGRDIATATYLRHRVQRCRCHRYCCHGHDTIRYANI